MTSCRSTTWIPGSRRRCCRRWSRRPTRPSRPCPSRSPRRSRTHQMPSPMRRAASSRRSRSRAARRPWWTLLNPNRSRASRRVRKNRAHPLERRRASDRRPSACRRARRRRPLAVGCRGRALSLPPSSRRRPSVASWGRCHRALPHLVRRCRAPTRQRVPERARLRKPRRVANHQPAASPPSGHASQVSPRRVWRASAFRASRL